MYITYEEYKELGGGISTTQEFERYEMKARQKVDYYTQSRIEEVKEIPTKIKYLMLELIEMMNSYEKNSESSEGIKEISNDGYTVSYDDKEQANNAIEFKAYSLIHEYAKEYCYRGKK